MKAWMRALFALSVLAAGATTQLSCSVNDYCLNCALGDGGDGDGGGSGSDDGGMTDDDALTDAGCVPTGAEECDGKDNDCNGLVDDGVLPGVGDLCSNQMGQCAGGVQECKSGAIKCSKAPMPESCNLLDDNCNGTVDDGDPGGGGKCGTDQGDCVAGVYTCNSSGVIECVGFIDTTTATETCDARDNDCDGNYDEGIGSLGPCGPTTDDGICVIGTLMCQGGSPVCQNAVFPQFETCNGMDDDCNGQTDELFDTNTNPLHCGGCNMPCPSQPNANTSCSGGMCDYACKPGFHDLTSAPGCEYGPCFASGVEECDGVDNDCDNMVDEMLTPPDICLSGGECGATAPVATCNAAMGWTCSYPGTTQFPETLCDGKNNDCDANIDEGQSNLGQACDDGGVGACRGTGTYACDAQNLNGPAVCMITQPGLTPAAQETCDDKDNDCDGKTDEGSETGDLLGQEWIDIGGGVEIMKYEASRFDASSTQQGTKAALESIPLAASPNGATQSGLVATFTTAGNHTLQVGNRVRVSGVGVSGYNGLWTVASTPAANRFTATLATSGLAPSGGGIVAKYKGACSRPGMMPWTNVTYPEALAACESMGASLCTETRWHQACSVVPPLTKPIVIDATNGTAIEAEDFTNNSANGSPETGTQCAMGNVNDDDGDGVINDGCPEVVRGVGPESGADCLDNVDDDGDNVVNDGCPVAEAGTGSESGAQCLNNTDDDGDNRVNDGCPIAERGTGGETVCTGNVDDDNDGRVNDGCPTAQEGGESGTQCQNNLDDDGDGRINDGCTAVGSAETSCNNNNDNDNDGTINDGCPAVVTGAGPESGNDCTDTQDDDNDGFINDGCLPFAQGVGAETNCTDSTDNDNDGVVNDGCGTFTAGVGAETGSSCTNNTDNDGDGFINDGCVATQAGAETGTNCANNIDNDNDGFVNDGCPSGAAAWIEDYTQDDPLTVGIDDRHSGMANMRAMPNSGANVPIGGALISSSRLDYTISIPTAAADWRIHVRMYSPTGNDDTVHVGIGPTVTAPGTTLTTDINGQWTWMSTPALNLTAGVSTLSLFMAEDGLKVDRIFIVRGTKTPPTGLGPAGGTWSYATNPTTYQAMTCNGADQSAPNDNILATGSLASCYANHADGGVFDMSGNVKEWTLARLPGQNPIRGGSSSDIATGISCGLNFTLGSDTFFFPNVGFRCCR